MPGFAKSSKIYLLLMQEESWDLMLDVHIVNSVEEVHNLSCMKAVLLLSLLHPWEGDGPFR